MELVLLIIVLALFEYIFFAARVGYGRSKYKIDAPAVSGHPTFERLYRVQQNTLEQLVLFIPALLVFSYLAEAQGWPGYEIAAGFGVVWLIGRALFARAYVHNPSKRALGFVLTLLPSFVMLLSSFVLILLSLV